MQPVSLEVFCESLVRGLLQWLSYACAAGLVGRKSCEGFVIVALAPVSVAVFCGSLVRGLFCRLSIYVDFYRHWVERRPPLQYRRRNLFSLVSRFPPLPQNTKLKGNELRFVFDIFRFAALVLTRQLCIRGRGGSVD